LTHPSLFIRDEQEQKQDQPLKVLFWTHQIWFCNLEFEEEKSLFPTASAAVYPGGSKNDLVSYYKIC